MAQTLISIYLHIVFSTKRRQKLIRPALEEELYRYMGGIYSNLECRLLAANGIEDHSHNLVSMSKMISVKHLQQEVKKSSSLWVNTERPGKFKFNWQPGYAAFSVSPSQLVAVKKYIADQKIHHQKMSFEEEYELLLKKHGCEYDERYFLD